MQKAFEGNWLPVFTGGLLVGGAILIPVSEGVRDATDVCGITHQAVACQPAIMPAADLPHPDHAPATPTTITTIVTSTATSTSTGTMPSTTVTGSKVLD
jgi:carbohydrate-binding DOMON domain-containing protein